jgi:uncharacterized protein (DUF488 family)
MEFFTIGVYNSTEQEFFAKLVKNRIDAFCDIRQRRGVRGSKYAFVNSRRLQARLAELGIKYGHVLQLAPPTEIRELQKKADLEKGEQKRTRQELGDVFRSQYSERILSNFDFDAFIDSLEKIGAKRVALFCVEEQPEACHRSIVADELQNRYDYEVTHI